MLQSRMMALATHGEGFNCCSATAGQLDATTLEKTEEVERLVVPSGAVQALRERVNAHCYLPIFKRYVETEGVFVGVDSVAEAAEAALVPVAADHAVLRNDA